MLQDNFVKWSAFVMVMPLQVLSVKRSHSSKKLTRRAPSSASSTWRRHKHSYSKCTSLHSGCISLPAPLIVLVRYGRRAMQSFSFPFFSHSSTLTNINVFDVSRMVFAAGLVSITGKTACRSNYLVRNGSVVYQDVLSCMCRQHAHGHGQ